MCRAGRASHYQTSALRTIPSPALPHLEPQVPVPLLSSGWPLSLNCPHVSLTFSWGFCTYKMKTFSLLLICLMSMSSLDQPKNLKGKMGNQLLLLGTWCRTAGPESCSSLPLVTQSTDTSPHRRLSFPLAQAGGKPQRDSKVKRQVRSLHK